MHPLMRIEITSEGLQESLRRSRSHFTLRGNDYHDEWFPIIGNEKEFEPISITDLRNDRRAGIYLIKQEGLKRAYVGLASNFSSRFFNGKDDCKVNCKSNCGCYGHINSTPRTCRSHRIIESGDNFEVYCLQEMEYATERVCQAEIDWYYILDELGFEMVNAVWALGVAGFNGRPIVSLNLQTKEYLYFMTVNESSVVCYGDRYSGNAGVISSTVRGFQNQFYGFTHRYATEDEVEGYKDRREVTELIPEFPRITEWIDATIDEDGDVSTLCSGCNGSSSTHKRNLRMKWTAGALSDTEIQHLRETSRGEYSDDVPTTEYKGVSWHSGSQGWQCRAKKGVSSKEFWQTGPLKDWTQDHDAALHRELKILNNEWEEFNTGKKGSNADLLNQNLSHEERGNRIFEDWG